MAALIAVSFLPQLFGLALVMIDAPLLLVLAIAVAIGLLMVNVFRYASNQKAIGRAKDRLKANLLAVRLFQDQLPVVMRAYARILLGTGSYLQLAFTPFLMMILPITFLIVQLDRYLGWMPLQPAQNFLVAASVDNADTLNGIQLQVPDGLALSAPPVHVPKDKEVVWRVVADRDGRYDLNIRAGGETVAKQVVVAPGIARVSPVRLRDSLLERTFYSGEPALPQNSPIASIAVSYSPRTIRFAWLEWNWIVLFFVVSLIAGFIAKSALGIQV
jgi:hypothetical protein